jgi:hypothetical protein
MVIPPTGEAGSFLFFSLGDENPWKQQQVVLIDPDRIGGKLVRKTLPSISNAVGVG